MSAENAAVVLICVGGVVFVALLLIFGPRFGRSKKGVSTPFTDNATQTGTSSALADDTSDSVTKNPLTDDKSKTERRGRLTDEELRMMEEWLENAG